MLKIEAAVRALDFVRRHVNVGTHSPNKVMIGMENERPPQWMIDQGKDYWTDYDDVMFAGSKDSWLTGDDDERLNYTKRKDDQERLRRAQYRIDRTKAGSELDSGRKLHGPGIAQQNPDGTVRSRNPNTWKQLLKYGKFVSQMGRGNCSDLAACAAYCLVMKLGQSTVDVVTLVGNDHAFATIGEPLPAAGYYRREFKDWQDNAAICDPWADIACLAKDFPARWAARMKNWASAGLLFVDSRGIKEAARGGDDSMKNLLDANKAPLIPVVHGRAKPLWL